MEPGWFFLDRTAPFDPAHQSPVTEWARSEGRGPHGAEELLCRLQIAERRRSNARRRMTTARRMAAIATNLAAALLAAWMR